VGRTQEKNYHIGCCTDLQLSRFAEPSTIDQEKVTIENLSRHPSITEDHIWQKVVVAITKAAKNLHDNPSQTNQTKETSAAKRARKRKAADGDIEVEAEKEKRKNDAKKAQLKNKKKKVGKGKGKVQKVNNEESSDEEDLELDAQGDDDE
jgi:uncharacterized protein YgiM (DUF1202 family)